jgi:hypothetical protein
MDTAIATWFVADDATNETQLPQMSGISSTQQFQNVYWRCVVGFFSTSLVQNPRAKHTFYTNTKLPVVDGVALTDFFSERNIDVVHLPIAHRLPRGVSGAWGNQFYVLDIIKHIAANGVTSRHIVLDSDCVWASPATRLEAIIDRNTCATYTLGLEEYPQGKSINGVTREQMAAALCSWRPEAKDRSLTGGLDYQGGELFAASLSACKTLAADIESLWSWQTASEHNMGFREDGHFMSILYALHGYPAYTANNVIKRMWTNLKFNNVKQEDLQLDIWHLPWEKKSGFMTLFRAATTAGLPQKSEDLRSYLARIMGVPRRPPTKFIRDLAMRIREKAAAGL